MLHLGIGRAHRHTAIIALIHHTNVTIIDGNDAGLSEHDTNPNQTYQPKRKNG